MTDWRSWKKFGTALPPIWSTLRSRKRSGKKSIGVKDVELYLKEARRLEVPVWATPKVLDLFVEGEAYGVEPPEKLRLTQWVDRLKAARTSGKK